DVPVVGRSLTVPARLETVRVRHSGLRPLTRSPLTRSSLARSSLACSSLARACPGASRVRAAAVEIGDDALDVGAGTLDTVASHRDQLAGAPDAFGEHVDVEVVALELLEDLPELCHRRRVPGSRCVTCRCAHRASCRASSTDSTTLVTLPAASSVTSC